MKVRELFTKWGFDVDFPALQKADSMIGKIKAKTDQVGANLQMVAQKITQVGRTMTMFFTLPLILAGVALANLAGDAVEVRNKFEAVFKELTPEMDAWVETFTDRVPRSIMELQEHTSRLQDTFVPLFGPEQRKKAMEFSQTLTELALDVASFSNAADKDVIQDFTSALVGNHETVRKYGIVINEARLNQELLNMGIAGGKKAAEVSQVVQARMNLIIQGTTDAHGDAAKTANSYANQVKALSGESKDLGAYVGAVLIPVMLALVVKLREVVAVLMEMDPHTLRLVLLGAAFTALIGPMLMFVGLIGQGVVVIMKLAAAWKIAGNASLIAQAKMSIKILFTIALIAILLGMIDELWVSMHGGETVMDDWNKYWDELNGKWKIGAALLGVLAGAIAVVASGGTLAVALLAVAVGAAAQTIYVVILDNWDKIKEALGNGWEWLKEKAREGWQDFLEPFKRQVDDLLLWLDEKIEQWERAKSALGIGPDMSNVPAGFTWDAWQGQIQHQIEEVRARNAAIKEQRAAGNMTVKADVNVNVSGDAGPQTVDGIKDGVKQGIKDALAEVVKESSGSFPVPEGNY